MKISVTDNGTGGGQINLGLPVAAVVGSQQIMIALPFTVLTPFVGTVTIR